MISRLLLAALVVAVGCQPSRAPGPDEAEGLTKGPDQESWDATLRITQEGRPRITIDAPYLARYETSDSTVVQFGPAPGDPPERVAVTVFDDEGQRTATLTAQRVRYDEQHRQFAAEGAVEVVSTAGKTLTTERLNWDEDDRTIRTDAFVQIVAPDETIRGYGLVADESLERYTIRRVTGQVAVEE